MNLQGLFILLFYNYIWLVFDDQVWFSKLLNFQKCGNFRSFTFIQNPLRAADIINSLYEMEVCQKQNLQNFRKHIIKVIQKIALKE